MINYGNGKIYKIWSQSCDKYYIGSTTKNYLSQRLAKHVADYKRWKAGKDDFITSFTIIELNDYKIELIELFSCGSRDELQAREGHFIRLFKNDIVNKCIMGRTKKEWNEDNKDKIKDQHKEYRDENKEKIKDQRKEYRNDNKDKMKEYNKLVYICKCDNKEHKLCHKSHHEKTKKHIDFINQQQSKD